MSWIDTDAHPIADVDYRAQCADQLDSAGALVLSGFFSGAFVDAVRAESADREAEGYFASSTHNIWLTPPDPQLGEDHIYNRQIVSTKGLLADDQVAPDSPLRAVYDDEVFRSFIADVVGVDAVHPYDDALSSINVHFHRDGEELGWHFDNSSFAVTMLIQPPEAGGEFEYVKDLRNAEAGEQNFAGVQTAIDTRTGVETLTFDPTDLVLFRGRNSMHRVAPSRGQRTRILVVMAFNTEAGIGLSESAKATFYGRS